MASNLILVKREKISVFSSHKSSLTTEENNGSYFFCIDNYAEGKNKTSKNIIFGTFFRYIY